MASLAELRAAAGATKRLPTRSYEMCLAQDLVSRVQALEEERTGLLIELGGNVESEDDGSTGKPSRIGDPRRTRVAEIDAEKEALGKEMREHTGTLVLKGIDSGDWLRWVGAHPPREDGRDEQGRPIVNPIDDRVAYGFCNAQALADDLLRYVQTWNDEPVDADDWAFLRSNAAPGDIKELVAIVVGMHEAVGARAPKSSSTSSPTTGTAETS